MSGGKVDTLATLLGELCKREETYGGLSKDASGSAGSGGFGISNFFSPRKRSTAQTQKVLKLIDDELEEELASLDSGTNLDKILPNLSSRESTPGGPGIGVSPGSPSPLRLRGPSSFSETSSETSVSSRSLANEKLRLKRHREYRQLQRLATSKQACFTQSQQALHDYVGSEARELGGVTFTRFMNDLYTRVFHLVNSAEPSERLGGVRAIGEPFF